MSSPLVLSKNPPSGFRVLGHCLIVPPQILGGELLGTYATGITEEPFMSIISIWMIYTAAYDEEGKLKNIYLAGEFGGFVIHIMQK